MIVERRWPTCISFAMLGDEKSTTTLDSTKGKHIIKGSGHYHIPRVSSGFCWQVEWGERSSPLLPLTSFAASSTQQKRRGRSEQAFSLRLCCTHSAQGQRSLPEWSRQNTQSSGSPGPSPTRVVHMAYSAAPSPWSQPVSLLWQPAWIPSGGTAELPAAQHISSPWE